MGPTRRPRKKEHEWEEHRSTIEKLFLRDKKPLDGIDGIIYFMKTKYHFIASKSQFETRLRKWGFQKNITKEEWVDAGRLINQRKDQGRESKVIFKGNVVSNSRVRKEMSRYHEEIGTAQGAPNLSTEISTRVIVRSPTPDNSSMALLQPDFALTNPRTERLIGLPSRIETNSVLTGRLDNASASGNSPAHSTSQPRLSVGTFDVSSLSLGDLPSCQVVDPLTRLIRDKLPIDTLSSLEIFSSTLLSADSSVMPEIISSVPILSSSSISFLPSRLRVRISDLPQVTAQLAIAVSHLSNNDYAYNTFPYVVQPLTLESPYDTDQPSSYYRNMADNVRLIDWFLSYLKGDIRSSMQNIQNYLIGPFKKRFVVNLWAIACNKWEYSLMEALLSITADTKELNPPVDLALFRWAVKNDQYRIADLVKAHIKATTTDDLDFIELLWKHINDIDPVTIEELRTFPGQISHHETDLLERALALGNTQFVEILLLRAHPKASTYAYWIGCSHIRGLVVRRFDESFAIRFFSIMMTYLPLGNVFVNDDDEPWRTSTQDVAILNGKYQLAKSLFAGLLPGPRALHVLVCSENLEMLSFFLSQGKELPAACLSQAVRNKNIRMVQFLTEAGVPPQSPHSLAPSAATIAASVSYLDTNCLNHFVDEIQTHKRFSGMGFDRHAEIFPCNTPHAEALRVGFDEAIEIFQHQIPKPYTADHLLSLIIVTAAKDDVEMMEEYLLAFKTIWAHDTATTAMTFVLETAVTHNSTKAGCKLIETGIFAQGKMDIILRHVVKKKNKAILEMILNSNDSLKMSATLLSEAVKTRDNSFLGEILPYFNGVEMINAICDAVYTGNLEMTGLLLSKCPYWELDKPSKYLEEDDVEFDGDRSTGYESDEDSSSNTSAYTDRYTPLTLAVAKGHMNMVSLLLDHGADPNYPKKTDDTTYNWNQSLVSTALGIATFRNDPSMIQYLIARGADGCDPAALKRLTWHRDAPTIQTLLEATGHNTAKRCPWFIQEALQVATSMGYMDIFTLLTGYAIGENKSGLKREYNFVREAVRGAIVSTEANSVDMLRKLLNMVDDVNAVICSGDETASRFLSFALEVESIDKIDILIDCGVNINGPPSHKLKRNPLQHAAGLGNLSIVSHLLSRGADVNAEPAVRFGATALQVAAIKGYVGIAELLLLRGALVNAPACKIGGRTAFEGATEWGKFDMMLLLVRNGADLTSEFGEKQFHRALEFARKNKKEPAVTFARQLYDKIKSIEMEVGMMSPLGIHDQSEIYPPSSE